MNIKPRRADSYEAQLSDGELIALHEALLGGRATLAKIRAEAPKWRAGHLTGRPPSEATLSNIRAELLLTATLKANEVTTDTLKEELKQEVPGLTDDQVESFGHRAFSLMAIRQQDVKAWVALRRTHKDAAQLRLEREKFEIAVATKLLDESMRLKAQEIADGTGTEAEKIAAMRSAYFADVDALQKAGTIKLPAP
jgi:hypothetical protein